MDDQCFFNSSAIFFSVAVGGNVQVTSALDKTSNGIWYGDSICQERYSTLSWNIALEANYSRPWLFPPLPFLTASYPHCA